MDEVTKLNTSDYWDDIYQNGEDKWNLKGSNPVWDNILKSDSIEPNSTIAILGAGKGYDAVTASIQGHNVTVFDFSKQAIDYCKQLAIENKVKLNFEECDFFFPKDKLFNKFDVVYEYVTFCAIDPSRRGELLSVVQKLLRKDGRLITVLFPIDERKSGPPYAIDIIEFNELANKEMTLEFMNKNIPSVKPRKKNEILLIYRK